ncbi:exonuclease SbcCD subunit D [Rothia nasimurium]|uniref:exonuclease SbcCD subunit D n=1 Tax=Rothia nasimurium TaxID=85336 RepID=UPI001F157D34|nr:exonuclease SbcCD subunit D [Rothia nasimurium]
MRILHTSDWHLGRTFHGTSLHSYAEQLLDELVTLVQEQGIDVVLISGDVYDQAQPRTETVQLFDRTLTRLVQAGVQVVATSGNHDSAIRLGFGSSLLSAAGVHLVTSQTQVGQPVLLAAGGVEVAFYGIPYLEPRPIAARWGTEASHASVLAEAMRRVEEDAATRQVAATVVLAHCFATGSEPSESERDISVGGVQQVPASTFAAASYTALGHLHGRQKVTDTVRYSGSLLAYSFSEQNHRKGAWIIDVAPDGTIEVSEHTWQTHLVLKTLKGTLDEVLAESTVAAYGRAFVSITLTDAERPAAALDRLKAHYEHVQELFFAPEGVESRPEHSYRRTRESQSVQAICESFYEHVRGRTLNEAEATYLTDVLDQARTRGASD